MAQNRDNLPLNLRLCLICQTESEEEALVENPRCCESLLNAVNDRVRYGEKRYLEISNKLKSVSQDELKLASWHRKCYQEATHSGMLKRARERFERGLSGPSEAKKKSVPLKIGQFTRSQTTPYSKDVCFFCDKPAGYREALRKVSTTRAGKSLHDAIEISGDERLRVKLSTAVDSQDAHAIDIRYHVKCWSNNVVTVLRRSAPKSSNDELFAAEIAAKLEFLTTTEETLRNGNVLVMSELQSAYNSILQENGVENKAINRKTLKDLPISEIDDVEFHKPKRLNESERGTVQETRDKGIQLMEEHDLRDEMKNLFDAALYLRKVISKSQRWTFEGSVDTLSKQHFPEELFCFFRWVINGPNATLSSVEKCLKVQKRAMNLVQSTMSMCLTERQIGNKKSQVIKSSREMPLQLAVGIAVHQAVRSKELVNMLRGFGFAVDYNRLLRVESELESGVIKRMEENDGIFLPPDIVKGRHIFFAIDNVDFAEDTYDGRNTLHGTAMAIYQRCHQDDPKPQIR